MRPIIYYRKSLMDKSELAAALKYFECVDLLSDIPENSLVIPRYSMYPFFRDQEREIQSKNSKLINSHSEHLYIADLRNYYFDLKEYTPETWFDLYSLPEKGPFILKGETNSKKQYWNTMMYAETKKDAIEVHSRLMQDSLLSEQNIYIRKYVPLVQYTTGIGGIPITKEFRFFCYKNRILSGGYYWQNYAEEIPVPDVYCVPHTFLHKIMDIVSKHTNYYVIDVAQTLSGNWILIELNDGIQSGLSMNSPYDMYSCLAECLI